MMRTAPDRFPRLMAPAVVLLAVAAILGGQAPSRAADGPCPDADGVTVVVDFSAFGAGVVVRCAAGPQASGFAALAAAGFSVEQPVNTPGFVCRIDGFPDAGQEPCVDTPPVDAYWSYWHAEPGSSWQIAAVGASRQPPPGTVDGWAFAQDAPAGAPPPPGTTPPAPATTTQPPTTLAPTAPEAPATTTIAPTTTTPTTTPPATTTSTTTTTAVVAATAPSTTGTTVAATTTTTDPGNPSTSTPAPSTPSAASAPADGGGSPAGALAGVAVVAIVAGGAGFVAWRRARAAPAEPGRRP